MRFFSKIAFICNLGFLVFIILGYIELNNNKNNNSAPIFPLPFVEGTLVVLGQFAIFVNLLFCLMAFIMLVSKRPMLIPTWLIIFNFTFLFAQVYYFFI